MNKRTKESIVKSFIWKCIEQYGSQIVTLAVTVVLARILTPDDYGLIALTTLFTSLADILVQASIGTALIQKKALNHEDCSTAMYLTGAMAVLVYFILYFAAPVAATWFGEPNLKKILRTLSIIIAFQGFNSVFSAVLMRNMQFKVTACAQLSGSILGGSIGIVAAFCGAGAWAIVFQRIATQAVMCLVFIINKKNKWGVRFSYSSAKEIVAFSGKLMFGSLIAFASDNIYTAVVGKCYTTEQLAYNDKADTLPRSAVLGIAMSVASVSLPLFSTYQDDKVALKDTVRKTIRLTTYVAFPMTIGIAATALPLVRVFFSDVWIPSAIIMQVLCLWYLTLPLIHINGKAIAATGNTKITMCAEAIKACITLLFVLLLATAFTVPVWVLVLVKGGISWLMIIINSFFTKRIYGYSLKEQMLDTRTAFLLSTLMFVAVFPLSYLPLQPIVSLAIQVCVGVVIYFGLSALFKADEFIQIMSMVKRFCGRGKMKNA